MKICIQVKIEATGSSYRSYYCTKDQIDGLCNAVCAAFPNGDWTSCSSLDTISFDSARCLRPNPYEQTYNNLDILCYGQDVQFNQNIPPSY